MKDKYTLDSLPNNLDLDSLLQVKGGEKLEVVCKEKATGVLINGKGNIHICDSDVLSDQNTQSTILDGDSVKVNSVLTPDSTTYTVEFQNKKNIKPSKIGTGGNYCKILAINNSNSGKK